MRAAAASNKSKQLHHPSDTAWVKNLKRTAETGEKAVILCFFKEKNNVRRTFFVPPYILAARRKP
jgi:hypothetical protein